MHFSDYSPLFLNCNFFYCESIGISLISTSFPFPSAREGTDNIQPLIIKPRVRTLLSVLVRCAPDAGIFHHISWISYCLLGVTYCLFFSGTLPLRKYILQKCSVVDSFHFIVLLYHVCCLCLMLLSWDIVFLLSLMLCKHVFAQWVWGN